MLTYERQEWACGRHWLAGVDEAGRGPLAGPVVAAAVMIDRGYLEAEFLRSLHGLTDSKKLTGKQRDAFFEILAAAEARIGIGVGVSEVDEIDRINILRATHRAMARAVGALPRMPQHLLVDGLSVPGLPCSATFITGGDRLSCLIAAASVVAKVTRDRMMLHYDSLYPQYGFARHKGYGTREHSEALLRVGPSPIHRRTFAPVRDLTRIQRTMQFDANREQPPKTDGTMA